MDQRFYSLDEFISKNLIPFNDSNTNEITPKIKNNNIFKNDLVDASSKNSVTLKSKLLEDGGLNNISIILEKLSKCLKLDSDRKIDLFISFLIISKQILKYLPMLKSTITLFYYFPMLNDGFDISLKVFIWICY